MSDALDKSEGIALFTDGSAWHEDRSGGWAWIAIDAFEGECQDSGSVSDTTNNRMEMTAWTEGLTHMYRLFGPCRILLYSDSQYVGFGAMDRYRKRNTNLDLWEAIDKAIDRHEFVEFIHLHGHSGHQWNEKVDKLASKARRQNATNNSK